MILRKLCTLLGLLAFVPAVASSADFQVIVHASNTAETLTLDQLEKIFLKKLVKWEDGTPISPVDQSASTPIRASFSMMVHGKQVGAVVSHWQQQIFAGKGVPPQEKPDNAGVIAFVKANPGAIGYLSGRLSSETAKLLSIRLVSIR